MPAQQIIMIRKVAPDEISMEDTETLSGLNLKILLQRILLPDLMINHLVYGCQVFNFLLQMHHGFNHKSDLAHMIVT